MKKITIWLTLIFAFVVFNTQAQIESFETTAVGSVPTGWTTYQSVNDDPGFSVQDQNGFAHDGNNYLTHMGEDISAESTSWVVSSGFTAGSQYELTFYWRGRWSSAYNFTGVYVSTASNDPVANPGDFTLLEELSPANYPNTWLQWNKFAVDFSQYSGQTVYIAFKYVGDFAHDFFVDEVSVAPMPYCDLPSDLVVEKDVNDFTVLNVSWTPIAGIDTYEVVWGAPGFDPNASGVSSQVVTANTYTITGLQESTMYDVYVRSYCSSYNYSSWLGPETATTSGPPPANNDCSGAVPLDVYAVGGSVGNETVADTTNATDSGNHPSCDNFGTNLDLWYTFTVPAGETKVRVLTGGSQGNSLEAALYDSCGGVEFDCKSPVSNRIFGGLTGGTTYTLQVWLDEFNSGDFTIALELLPPGPGNDDCSGAINLNVDASGACTSPTLVDNLVATDSGVPDPGCGFYQGGDLWYSVTVPSTGALTIETSDSGGGISDTGMAVYSGDCTNLSLIECDDDGASGLFSQISLFGLTAGDVLYVRVWEYGNNTSGTFNICAWEDPYVVTPPNDYCSGAINLTVYPYQTGSGNELAQSTLAATDSGNHPSCDNTGTNLDLWYTVTVPAGETGFAVITGGNRGSNIEAALYDACGGVEYDCQGNGSFKTFNGLTSGTTYYLQVWLDDFNSGNFDILIETLPTPPANDDCANATALTVYPYQTGAGNELAQSTLAATDSGNHPSCDNTGTNLDLWYTVTVPAGETGFAVITGGDKGSSIEAALYDACGGIELDCQGNSDFKTFNGLTSGTTYYLQVWLDDFNSGNFDILIETLPTPPANDDCANATGLTVYPYQTGAGNELAQSTLAATDSGNHPSCDTSGTNLDLWYTVTVPAGETGFAVITGGDKGSSIEAALYDACGGTELDCQGNSSYKTFSGLTAGTTYYLQVWLDDFNSGDFDILIETLPTPPANDLCSGAINITPTNSCAPIYATNMAALDSGVPDPGCANYNGGDIWFTSTIAPSGNLTVETSAGNTGNVSDTGMAVYSGSCGSLTLIDCNDDGGTGLYSLINLTGMTPGETVYIRVWEYGNNSFGEIGVCAYDSSVSVSDNTIDDFKYYPNPVNDVLKLEAKNNINTINVYNMTGQEVISLQPKQKHVAVSTAKLPKGVYFVKISIGNEITSFKIVKE